MANLINRRQNETEALNLLYCQRITYDKARVWGIIIFVIAIFSTATIVLPIWFDIDKNILASTNILITVINGILFMFRSRTQELGARFQNHFDFYVYQLKQNSYDKIKDIPPDDINVVRRCKKICEFKKKHLSCESLENWYSDVSEFSNEPAAILMCQLENVNWTYKLKTVYSSIVIGFLGFLLLFTFTLYSNESINYILNLIISLPLLTYIFLWGRDSIGDYLNHKNLKSNAESLYSKLLESGKIQIADCIGLQNDIFQYRKSCLLVPNYFYWLFRNSYQSDSGKTTKYRIEKLKENYPMLFKSNMPKFITPDI